jgi:hypothetical protein
MLETFGWIGAVALPLWNIPLIVRIETRKSSKDISLSWTLGVMSCLLLMLPSGLKSPDSIYRMFAVANALFFAGVTIQVLRYR